MVTFAPVRSIVILLLVLTVASVLSATEGTYYISPTGNDNNPGDSPSSAFATFDKALSVLSPGDTLNILPGTYQQRVSVDISGTAQNPIIIQGSDPSQKPMLDLNYADRVMTVGGQNVIIQDIEITQGNICVRIDGTNITMRSIIVNQCQGHGVLIRGQNVIFEDSTVSLSNLDNSDRVPDTSFGSGLKVAVGASNILLRNNRVYHNYGEGIAVTRGVDVQVLNNVVYDNFAANIYIDNSYNILVDGNLIYCTADTNFDRLDGTEPFAIGLGEEEYAGWGAQLANVQVVNNIADSCGSGIGYFAIEVPNSGLDRILIAYNTFWRSDRQALSINVDVNQTKTNNTIIANNIFDNVSGAAGWVNDRAGIAIFNNLWVDGNPSDSLNVDGPNDRYGDPQFATTPNPLDPSTYQITLGSPAFAAADDLHSYNIRLDFEDKMRDKPSDIGANEAVRLQGPEGYVLDSLGKVTYVWSDIPGANNYRLIVYQISSSIKYVVNLDKLADAIYCDGETCTLDIVSEFGPGYWLSNGNYFALVRANNSMWSQIDTFVIDLPTPAPVTFQLSADTYSRTPTLNWTLEGNAVGAAWFKLVLTNNGLSKWVRRDDVCGSFEGTTCSYTLLEDEALTANGTYQIWAQGWGPGGTSTWASSEMFKLGAAVPSDMSMDSWDAGSPILSWTASDGAEWYQVWIGTLGPTVTEFGKWYSAEAVGCDADTNCLVDLQDTFSGSGPYEWWMRAWAPGGYSGWVRGQDLQEPQ